MALFPRYHRKFPSPMCTHAHSCVSSLSMLLGMLSELALDYLHMIDSMSPCLKDSSGLSNWCLLTHSYHLGKSVVLVLCLVIKRVI